MNALRVNEPTLTYLRTIVDRHLDWNGRRFISMGSLFSFMSTRVPKK